MKKISGVITALVTPFLENGEIDYLGFEKLIEKQITSSVETVIIGGTTGEGMLIENIDEFYIKAIRIINKRLNIGINLFASNKQELVKKIKLYNDLNVDFILVNTPFYMITSNEGLFDYFEFINNHINKPFIIYYNPVRSGQFITYSTWNKLLKLSNLLGVKDASHDGSTCNYLIKSKNDKLYFTGNDDLYLNQLILGSDGVISSITNVFPEYMISITNDVYCGNYKTAKEMFMKMYDLIKHVNVEPNPIGIKFLLEEQGIINGYLKFPLRKLSFNNQVKLKKIYEGVCNENISDWQG